MDSLMGAADEPCWLIKAVSWAKLYFGAALQGINLCPLESPRINS
jgi:hypothetical protein